MHGHDPESWLDRLPEVLTDLGVGVVVGDAERAAFVVNDAFCTMTGYSTQEVLALRPFVKIFAPEARSAIVGRLARQLAGDNGAPPRYDTEILARDGGGAPVAVSVQAVWRAGDGGSCRRSAT